MQRNAYKGSPPRPWIRIQLVVADGQTLDLEVVADTGSPFGLIIGTQLMERVRLSPGPNVATNFGTVAGGLVHTRIVGTEFDEIALGHAGDSVFEAVQASNASFEGVIGLPLLHRVEYGGDANEFWVL